MNWFVLVVVTLTATRLTRLVVWDTFPPIAWVRDRLTGPSRREYDAQLATPTAALVHVGISGPTYRWRWVPDWLAKLVDCHWCASVWVTGGLVLLVDLVISVPLPWLTWGAAAALAPLLLSAEDKLFD